MDMKKSKRLLIWLAAAYWVMAVLIYAIGYEQFRTAFRTSTAYAPAAAVGELTDGMELRQQLEVPVDQITQLEIMADTYAAGGEGVLNVCFADAGGQTVSEQQIPLTAIRNWQYTGIPLDQPVSGLRGENLTLILTTQHCQPGSGVLVYFGNSISAGRAEVAVSIPAGERYVFNGTAGEGRLCIRLSGTNQLHAYITYWIFVTALFAGAAFWALRCWKKAKEGRNNLLVGLLTMFTRYSFLLRQLVTRDFKIKYKRSVLGMFWSFLNPLLTMSVQYLIFSALFKSDIPNYPVYLLSGLVFFNFFNEAVSMGMTSITGNAALIKKVYMPKYIYPLSRVMSSLVNFALALLPLFLVMLFTGTVFTPAMLLLVYDILCLVGFVTGMVLLLSTAMTFFQDTQFLWSVVSLMWMYLTPIFYPDTIITPTLLPIYRMNPMYQYITFARSCLISGVSPEPAAYLGCMISSVLVLGAGLVVFRKHQDRFILHL